MNLYQYILILLIFFENKKKMYDLLRFILYVNYVFIILNFKFIHFNLYVYFKNNFIQKMFLFFSKCD